MEGSSASPRVRPSLEGPSPEPRCAAAAAGREEDAAVPRRSRAGQADHRLPAAAACPDLPALGHGPLHLPVGRRRGSGGALRIAPPLRGRRVGVSAGVLFSHRIVLLRLRWAPREGERGPGARYTVPQDPTCSCGASRGALQDALRTGIVRPFDSGAFGMCTWSTPFSKVAVMASAATVRGRVKERWKPRGRRSRRW